MARAVTTRRKVITTAAAWAIGLLIFFPIYWTILTSFKTEAQAINDPPIWFFFDWTLDNYSVVQGRSDYMRHLWNSVLIAGGSTLIGILIAVLLSLDVALPLMPAAWAELGGGSAITIVSTMPISRPDSTPPPNPSPMLCATRAPSP